MLPQELSESSESQPESESSMGAQYCCAGAGGAWSVAKSSGTAAASVMSLAKSAGGACPTKGSKSSGTAVVQAQ